MVALTRSVAVLTILAAACQAPSLDRLASDPSELPYPVDEEGLVGPGLPLLDGFVVTEGTWLLGSVFPQRNSMTLAAHPRTGREEEETREWFSWSALLVLAGDPRAVVEAYVEQAHGLGFSGLGDPMSCDELPQRVVCESSLHQPFPADFEERTDFHIQAVLDISNEGADGWPTAYVHIDVGGLGYKAPPGALEAALTRGSNTRNQPEGLPRRGDQLARATFEVNGEAVSGPVELKVEPESSLLAPPTFEFVSSLAPGFMAVLRTDDGPSALAGYRRQAERFFEQPTASEEWQLGEFNVRQEDLICPGGCGHYQVRSITDEEGKGFLLISVATRS